MNEVNTKSGKISEMEQEWAKARPDLIDHLPNASLIGRLLGTAYKIDKVGKESLADDQLGQTDFDMLACLRRSCEPYILTPNDLLKDMMITTGSLTACAGRLIKKGLIERTVSETDQRSRNISLTPQGIEVVDRLIVDRFKLASDITKILSDDEQTQLKQILIKLSDSVD